MDADIPDDTRHESAIYNPWAAGQRERRFD